MSCCMVMLSPPSCPDGPCLVFLISPDNFDHNCGWDLVLSGPTVFPFEIEGVRPVDCTPTIKSVLG